jgi:hypothetical protein
LRKRIEFPGDLLLGPGAGAVHERRLLFVAARRWLRRRPRVRRHQGFYQRQLVGAAAEDFREVWVHRFLAEFQIKVTYVGPTFLAVHRALGFAVDLRELAAPSPGHLCLVSDGHDFTILAMAPTVSALLEPSRILSAAHTLSILSHLLNCSVANFFLNRVRCSLNKLRAFIIDLHASFYSLRGGKPLLILIIFIHLVCLINV